MLLVCNMKLDKTEDQLPSTYMYKSFEILNLEGITVTLFLLQYIKLESIIFLSRIILSSTIYNNRNIFFPAEKFERQFFYILNNELNDDYMCIILNVWDVYTRTTYYVILQSYFSACCTCTSSER